MKQNLSLPNAVKCENNKKSHRTARDNVSGTLLAVSKFRWYRQFPLLAYAHVQKTLVPSFDDLSDTQLKGERLISVQTATEKIKQSRFKTCKINLTFSLHVYINPQRGNKRN